MRQHCAEFRANFRMVFMDDVPSKKASDASAPRSIKKINRSDGRSVVGWKAHTRWTIVRLRLRSKAAWGRWQRSKSTIGCVWEYANDQQQHERQGVSSEAGTSVAGM
jgi:hypothetical protein